MPMPTIYCLSLVLYHFLIFFFFFNDTATTEIYTLSLHDALPISDAPFASRSSMSGNEGDSRMSSVPGLNASPSTAIKRSEEHTSELQSHVNLVCRLLLEKKKKKKKKKDKHKIKENTTTTTQATNV